MLVSIKNPTPYFRVQFSNTTILRLKSNQNPINSEFRFRGATFITDRRRILQETRMSRGSTGKSPKVDLKLNLTPPRMQGSTSRMVVDDEEGSSNNSSSPKSCVSSAGNSPEVTSMVLAGCPRCLMYVMLAQDDPKCPKCKSTVLLDFNNHNSNGNNKKNRKG